MGYRRFQTEIAPAFLRDATADAWHRASGDAKDAEIDRLKRAVKARMPLLARPDAVAEIGSERSIERLPGESDAAYAQRVTHAWESWQWAGTPYGVLVALSDLGYPGAVLVVPNGKSYRLVDGDLVVGALPAGSWSFAVPGWAQFDVVFPADAAHFVEISAVSHSGVGDAGAVARVTGRPTGAHTIVLWVYEPGPVGVASLDAQIDGGWYSPIAPLQAGSNLISGFTDPLAPDTGLSIEIPGDAVFESGGAWMFSTAFAPPAADSAPINAIRRAVDKWRPCHAVPRRLAAAGVGESWGWPLGTWGDAGTWGATVTTHDL